MTKEPGKDYPDCWIFDKYRERYTWRENWIKVEIVGETAKSWVTNYFERKVPKKGGNGYAFCEAEIDRLAFIEQRCEIGEAVKRCTDYETLQRIADAVGYSG
jgi:hypothetical protein